MQVKKFEAPTMQEALKVIKRELGPEAIILSTKHIKSGFGLMSKASVEVTAAIAEKDLKKKIMAEKNLPAEVKEKIWNSKAEKQSEIYNNYFDKQLSRAAKDRVEISAAKSRRSMQDDQSAAEQFRAPPREQAMPSRQAQAAQAANLRQQQQQQERQQQQQDQQRARQAQAQAQAPRERRYADISDDETPAQARRAVPAPQGESMQREPMQSMASAVGSDNRTRELERDIEQLKSMIVDLAGASQGGSAASSATSHTPRDESDSDLTDELVRTMHDLVAGGVEKKFARQIVRQASFDLSSIDRHDEAAIVDRVAFHLVNEIQVKDLLQGVGAREGVSRSTVVALVGPTGVGKTTTIAKIASLGILEKRLRVGLINLDSYKVAATEQLATYAKIMNIPFRSVNTKDELQQAIYDFSSLDLVLIDTTGRSQKDQESLLQLRHMLAAVEGCQNVLLASATTKDSDMNEVVSRFKIFHPVGMVFSKLDETSVYGCIYNVQKRSGLPLLYFTVGQRVPEDIEKASAERVADLVLDL